MRLIYSLKEVIKINYKFEVPSSYFYYLIPIYLSYYPISDTIAVELSCMWINIIYSTIYTPDTTSLVNWTWFVHLRIVVVTFSAYLYSRHPK